MYGDPKIVQARAECEIPGHDAHHGVRRAIEHDFPVYRGGVSGKAPLPQRVADHRHRGAGAVLLLGEHAARQGFHAEHVQEISRHRASQHLFGGPIRRQVGGGALRGGHVAEDVIAPLPLDEVPRRRGVPREAGRGSVLPDHHHAIGVGIGQRPQEHGVHGRENCGVGADAQRQRAHRHGGESGRVAQQPEAVT